MDKNLDPLACSIIEALGGTSATAIFCEVKPPSVTEWKTTGIPKARLMFLKLARPDLFVTEITADGPKISEPQHVTNLAGAHPIEALEEDRRSVDLGYRQPADPQVLS
jgi:hypothetical protein